MGRGDGSGGDGGWEIVSEVALRCSGGGGELIRGVTLHVKAPPPLVADPVSTVIDVSATSGSVVSVVVRCPDGAQWTCHDTAIRITATHTTSSEPRVLNAVLKVPFSALCIVSDSNTDTADVACAVQIRLGTKGPRRLPPLLSLRGVLCSHPSSTASLVDDHAVVLLPDGSLAHLTHEDGVYTVSSDTLGSTWLLLDTLVSAAEELLGQGSPGGGGSVVALVNALTGPLDAFFSAIDSHFSWRHEVGG